MSDSNIIKNYSNFVYTMTSNPSKDHEAYIARLNELHASGLNIALFDTGSTGLNSESGELIEIIKKIKFQGKEFNEEVRFHLKRELGDILFYWIDTCISLDLDPVSVILENVEKLKSRYPGGNFDIFHSENRKEGDL